MADEPTYHEALDQYANVTTIRERFGRKRFRDGRWEKFTTPERQVKALSEMSDPVREPLREVGDE